MSSPARPTLRRAAFSLTELLVVIGVISILIGLMMPVFSAAKEQSRQVVCQSNIRQIALAMLMYAQSNGDRLPSTAPWWTNAMEHDWIHWQRTGRQLKNSAIARYLSRDVSAEVFRCPSDNLDAHPNQGTAAGAYLYSYTMNVNLGYSGSKKPPRVSRVRRASDIIMLIDEEDTCIDDGTWIMNAHDTDYLSTVHDHTAKISKQKPTSGQMNNPKSRGVAAHLDGHVAMISKTQARDPRYTQPN